MLMDPLPNPASKHISTVGMDSRLLLMGLMTKSHDLSLQRQIYFPYISIIVLSILHHHVKLLNNQIYQNVVVVQGFSILPFESTTTYLAESA